MIFKINDELWRLKFVPPYHPCLYRSDGSKTIAACDDKSKTIYLENTLTQDKMKKVLCHELTHAAMFSYNIEMDLTQEEIIADFISTYGEEVLSLTNSLFKKIFGNSIY